MPDADSLDVALATWNGATWLPEQLASLAAQTRSAAVVAGDDGSGDATPGILGAWADRLPGGLRLLPGEPARLGAAANFSRVLSTCAADWVACCDQDDVWDADHLERLLAAGRACAATLPAGAPVLVVADMRVVDGEGRPLHPSFWGRQGFDPRRGARLRSLAVMNIFPGCAMLANRALLRLVLPVPAAAPMHDWWMALCAAALGGIAVVAEPVGSYRVHGGNALGAGAFTWRHGLGRLATGDGRVRAGLLAASRQCAALVDRHRDRLPSDAAAVLEAAAGLGGESWLGRRRTILRNGLARHPWQRQLNLLLRG